MKFKTAAALGASWLAIAGAAEAQAPADTAEARAARIQELEQRLEALETQLLDLKEGVASDSADIRRIQGEAVQVTVNNGRPTFATPNGAFRTSLRGVIQYDAANYIQDDNLPAGAVQDLSGGANFRRARIGIEGTVFKDWNYAITYEAGGSGAEATGLQQAWLEYAGWKPFGLTAPVRFRAGAFAVENTLEGATSNTDSIFLERASAAELVRGTFGGDGRNAFGVFANGDRLSTSLVLTGNLLSNTDVAPTPADGPRDEGWGYVARVGGLVLREQDYSVHLGANYSAIVQLSDASSTTAANTVQLRERPELRVDASATNATARLIDTGALSAENLQAYGVEFGGQWKNFYLASEWLQIDVDRPGARLDPSFSGYYVQGAWTITGERRAWNAANGGYGGIRPTDNFDLSAGKWGAWEIAARYSVLDLNDLEFATTAADRVRGGEQTISTLGLNWYPNSVVRFLLDYQDVEIDRLNAGGAQIGQDYQAIALRSQVAF